MIRFDATLDVATTEHTATLHGHGTVDVITVTYARSMTDRTTVRVVRYTLIREGRAPQAVSLAAIREYGLDVDHVRAAISAAC